MRDAVAWSYYLLDPGEQAVFRQVTVFVGGGALEAAEAVCDRHDRDVWTTLDTLLSQSLIPAVGSEPGRCPLFSQVAAEERLRTVAAPAVFAGKQV